MYPKTRKEAMQIGETKYFTSKPCIHGHISYRYTVSGACAECVSANSAANYDVIRKHRNEFRESIAARRAEKLAPIVEKRREKDTALRALVDVKVPIYPQDVATVFDTAIGLCIAAFPVLERADVEPEATTIRGTPLYRVSVPVEHVELIRGIANQLYNAHGPDMNRVHDQLAEQANNMANAESSEPPERLT